MNNMLGTVYALGGNNSTMEVNDYLYDTGTANMYYDINGSPQAVVNITPDVQTPRAFEAVSWDSGMSNVIVSGAATSSGAAVVKYLMVPSTRPAFTIYANPNSVNNYLGTFFYHTAVQQLFDEVSTAGSALHPEWRFWYWNFSSAAEPSQPIYFQNIGGINGLGLLALGGGTAPSMTSTPRCKSSIRPPASWETLYRAELSRGLQRRRQRGQRRFHAQRQEQPRRNRHRSRGAGPHRPWSTFSIRPASCCTTSRRMPASSAASTWRWATLPTMVPGLDIITAPQ